MQGDPRWGEKPKEPLVVALGWAVVNFLQAVWLASFTVFCFFLTTGMLMVTWSRRMPLWTARRIWGPMNIRAGGGKLLVEGQHHVQTPCIVMMNHQSMIDVAVAFAANPVNVRFIAKKETIFIPFVGWYMWAMGMVFLDRKNLPAATAALKKGAAALKEGAVLMAFPEGTRTKDGTIGPFKKGLFMLAIEAGVPIVPCAMDGAGQVLPVKGWHPRPGVIRVKFGAPIATSGFTPAQRDELVKLVHDRIIDLHLEIGGLGGDRERFVSGRGADARRRRAAVAVGGS
jgi:1-acyl-sn-glycerol-3-phosphate acyltransferase